MSTFYKVIIIAASIVLIVGSFFLGRWSAEGSGEPQVKTEVVERVRVDTIVSVVPKYIHSFRVDTVRVVVPKDSCSVILPIEERVYQDSTYRAVVRGYNPILKEIEVFQRTVLRTETVTINKKSKFNFGIQVGVGPQFGFIHRQADVGIYAGIGIQYNF